MPGGADGYFYVGSYVGTRKPKKKRFKGSKAAKKAHRRH